MFLHPDDVLFFDEISGAMHRVAKHYGLILRSVTPEPNPELATSALGRCFANGDIHIVMRAKANGQWHPDPLEPQEVWNTAAHELAHLRHFNHGKAFQEFEEELMMAMRNQQEDHRDKVIRKLLKMQQVRDGEAKLGNTAAAEAFAGAINRMLIENELNPSDLDYARAADNDPVVKIRVDLSKYRIEATRTRIAWHESLARIVSNAHLCTFLVQAGSNQIWLVGTKSRATIAEYVYGTLVRAAHDMSIQERYRYAEECKRNGTVGQAHVMRIGNRRVGIANGFRESWLAAFIERIDERMQEARREAVAAAPEGTSQALVRLDGALLKVRSYMDMRFFHKKRKYVSALNGGNSSHTEGRARGRAAADRIAIGRRGITGAKSTRGLIG